MPEPHFAVVEDDLPRTFLREREARQREAREREAREREATRTVRDFPRLDPVYAEQTPEAAAVGRLRIPFFHLMRFFVKAVFAAIPALIILGALLWLGGVALSQFFPQLSKMQILIHFPQ